MAIFAALRFRDWTQLARDLRVSRDHLVAIRGARESGVGFKLAILVDNILGPRYEWVLNGTGSVFDAEKVPARYRPIFETMDFVISDLLRQRLGPGEGLPVFENLEAVTTKLPELPVELPPDKIPANVLGSTEPLTRMTWLAYQRRAAALLGATIGDAFFVKVDDGMKKALDTRAEDYALFAYANWFGERFRPAEGDSLVCMVESAGKRRLMKMNVVAVEENGGEERQVESGVLVASGGNTRAVLRPATKTRLVRGESLAAVVVRVERDLA